MKDRVELSKYFKEKGFNLGAEIGVFSGEYSMTLCKANPDLKLYCIDAWGIGDPGGYRIHFKAFKEAVINLKPFNTVLLRMTSMDALIKFEDESLDFVYIDSNHHYNGIKEDIEGWTPKVRKRGIVSGHDYCLVPQRGVGVKRAVDEYVSKYNYKLMLTEGNLEDPKSYDNQLSWFFIK